MHKCNKPPIVYAQKKIPAGRIQVFKIVAQGILFFYGSSVEELVGPENFKEFHIRQNLKCIDQVEVLKYREGFTSYRSHCGTKCASKLSCGTNKYPICSDCAKKKKQLICQHQWFAKK